jgi:nucleoside-diphosphate-sugar epimerase
MRVIVTGAGGFIGSHIVELLNASGDEVFALDSKSVDLLRERRKMRAMLGEIGATHLIHCAWTATPGKYIHDPANHDWLSATIELASAFIDAGGRRLVAAGSCAEYDPNFGYAIEGETPAGPATPYAQCKDVARRILEAMNVSFAWARVFFPYGPREHADRLTPFVARALLSGGTAAVSAGTQVRDFLHVRDVARAFIAIARSDATGPINVSSSQPVTVRDFVTRLGRALGGSERIDFGARPMRADEPPLLVGNNRRLRSETGWKREFDLDAGIADTAGWWRSQVQNDVR